MSHFGLLVLYAGAVSLFFALLWRHGTRDRLRLFAQLLLALVLGAVVVAYLMYPVPSGPPAPIP
jgi:hypothetical protein